MSSTVGRNSLIMASGTAASRVDRPNPHYFAGGSIGTTGLAANAIRPVR